MGQQSRSRDIIVIGASAGGISALTALVQDPATAEYASMPDSALRHVETDGTFSCGDLAREITRRVGDVLPDEVPAARKSLRVENLIAMESNDLQAGVMELGTVSAFTCPECGGVLVQIRHGSIVRYRCHTGHAFSLGSRLSEIEESIDAGLWSTLRAMEERVMLLDPMQVSAEGVSDTVLAKRARGQPAHTRQLEPLRQMVLDSTMVADVEGPDQNA